MLDYSKTDSYDYNLPKELIAKYPISPASDARLLVYNRKTNEITHTTFNHLLEFIPKNSSIFLNDTKVIKARIFGKKESGGKIELLFNKPIDNNEYLVMIRGKVKIGTLLYFDDNLTAKIIKVNDDGSRIVVFYKDNKQLEFLDIVKLLEKIGHLPLPPYMNREDNEQDNQDYQTLFAKNYGAVAAPTASLHFTEELLQQIRNNFNTHYLTLHVGAGTFKPVEADNILEHAMHSEYYNINDETLKALNNTEKVLAVGTTVTRTIEYFARTKITSGECNLFLNPLNEPIKVDYLLTNFHLPKSTLIMLVASFIGLKKTKELYDIAIKEKYRFFSYGDGMLII